MRKVLALAAVFAGLVWLERRRPLRVITQPRGRRLAINATLAGITGVAVGAIQKRVSARATAFVESRQLGLTRVLPLPHWLVRAAGVVLLDYTLWHWHRLNHRIPGLWRMHASHHADPDLDASTALRFHAGEMLASVPYRAAQVILLGIDRATLRAWETALIVAIMFHHSNLRLPATIDAGLSRLIITPRLHGIHHSARPRGLDTNFGTVLSLWDMLHRTRETRVDQGAIAIGLSRLLGGGTPTIIESLRLPLARDLVTK